MNKIFLRSCLILILTLFSAPILAESESIPSFSLYEASYMLFHHYDEDHKISVWEHIPFPSKKEKEWFWGRETGLVSAVFFSPFVEKDKNKYFLLTKTIPVGQPFSCHACLPLLSAAVFVGKNHRWIIESKNLFLMYEGEYAVSPRVKLVDIPNRGYGLLLAFSQYGDGRESVKRLMVIPRGSSIHSYLVKSA